MTLSDSLTIDPGKMSVTAGVPVRFVVTNDGALDHTFFIGTDKEQKTREAGDGEPGTDRFIAVPPGETVELLTTPSMSRARSSPAAPSPATTAAA